MQSFPVFFEIDARISGDELQIVAQIRTLLFQKKVLPLPFANALMDFENLLQTMRAHAQKPGLIVVSVSGADGYIMDIDSLIGDTPLLMFQREMMWLKKRGKETESQKVNLGIQRMRQRSLSIWYYGKANCTEVANLAAQRIQQFLSSGDFTRLDSSVGLIFGSLEANTSRIRRQIGDHDAQKERPRSTLIAPPPLREPPSATTQHVPGASHHKMRSLPALAGQLSDQNLPQVLQFLNQNQKTGELQLETAGREALFVIDKGQLIYAVSGGLEGVEAVYACARECEGTFWFEIVDMPPARKRNVTLSMMEIAFECCRLMDEAGQGASEDDLGFQGAHTSQG